MCRRVIKAADRHPANVSKRCGCRLTRQDPRDLIIIRALFCARSASNLHIPEQVWATHARAIVEAHGGRFGLRAS
jgi:hypothetical protein